MPVSHQAKRKCSSSYSLQTLAHAGFNLFLIISLQLYSMQGVPFQHLHFLLFVIVYCHHDVATAKNVTNHLFLESPKTFSEV